MKARARIAAEPDGRGGTRLTELYGEAPLLVRRTGPGEVHLVGGAAGPLGGDVLTIDVSVAAGAILVVRSVAATIALPGDGASHHRVHATVHGTLRWLPEPIVAAHGCDHVAESIVDLGPTGRLTWREVLVCGRHGEAGGDLTLATTVRRDGRTLYRHELAVGPHAPGWTGAAVLGGARAYGSLVVIDPDVTATPYADGRSALMPLSGEGFIVTAIADHAHELRRALVDPSAP